MKKKSLFSAVEKKIVSIGENEERLRQFMFRSICLLLAVLGFAMSMADLFLYKQSDFPFPTLAFSVLCVVNIILYRKNRVLRRVAVGLFMLEMIGMIYFLVASGQPDGFSALWISMIPIFSVMILKWKAGSVFFLITFLELIFLLWTPWGSSLLQYEYTPAFHLRFPLLYFVLFVTAFFFEIIRNGTHRALEKARDSFEALYVRDPLTAIYNRYGFRRIRDKYLSPCENGRAMAMLDLDHFKQINDRFGHDSGDDILIEFVKIVQDTVGEDGVLSRWGGEEFMLLLKRGDTAGEVCQRVLTAVGGHTFVTNTGETSMTVSIGLVVGAPGESLNYQQLLRLADRALLQAKNEGRNRIITKIYTEKEKDDTTPESTGASAP